MGGSTWALRDLIPAGFLAPLSPGTISSLGFLQYHLYTHTPPLELAGVGCSFTSQNASAKVRDKVRLILRGSLQLWTLFCCRKGF